MDQPNPTIKQYKNNYNNLKRNYILAETMNGFLDKMKKASKGVVDAGAKTMLKVRHFYWSNIKRFFTYFHFRTCVHSREM